MKFETEQLWKIINKFITKKYLIRHQIESYDTFLTKYVRDIITENNPITLEKKIDENESIKYIINLENITYGDPVFTDNNGKLNIMYPENARKMNMTYTTALCIDLNMNATHYKDGNIIETQNVSNKNEIIGHIPLMIGSKFCKLKDKKNSEKCSYDKGGYFIINGSDKVVISQERMADNNLHTFKMKDGKYSHVCEVRTNKDMTKMANVFRVKYLSKDGIRGACLLRCSFNNLKDDISLLSLFKYLGAENDTEILKYILGNSKDIKEYIELLKPSFVEYNEIVIENKGDLTEFYKKHLLKKTIDFKYIVDNKVLNALKTNKEKMFYIGHMTKTLLDNILGKIKESDRDNFINKRIETPGILMAQLFRQLYRNMTKAFKKTIFKDNSKGLDLNINKFIKKSIIDNGLKHALSTGNWNSKVGVENKKVGIAQVLNRLTFSATLSHLRRMNAPIGKKGKMIEPRKLHNSQYGYICPAETPEGHGVGLLKNMSLSTQITPYSNSESVKQLLRDMETFTKIEDISPEMVDTQSKVFVNGLYYGITIDACETINFLKSRRREGKLNYSNSFVFKIKENKIKIYTDEGRCTRPLLIVKDNKLDITEEDFDKINKGDFDWKYLLNNGIIEFLDISEQETAMIAITQDNLSDKYIKFTHCEIHPSLMLGVCASLIPFPDHNQSPRNAYQSSMCKQAIGIDSQDVFQRMDTINHVLHYPQRPIVYTQASEILGFNEMPAGENLIIAIAMHGGYNMEDSVIVNRGSIERGLFHSTSYRTYKTEEKRDMTALSEEKFCIPDKNVCLGLRNGSYSKLNKNGLPIINSKVDGNDIIIGKMTPIINKRFSKKKDITYKDTSVQLRHNEDGYVDKVEMTHNQDGYRLVKVKVRSHRVPEMADKMASRHGQKGTIGLIMNEEDMPFTEDGVTPDVIINPCCMPSRMTIAQLIECVMSKIGATKGKFFDGTPFENVKMEDLVKEIEETGFEGSGYETMYSGETGEQLKSKIFIGPTYYQRLKHMVKDKMHARATGPNSILTRQALEGRSREGGLRLGEMETNCQNSHGAAYFLKQKTFDDSDKFEVHLCDKCNQIGVVNEEENIYFCKNCDNKSEFSKVNMPYASKLLWMELKAMSMVPKFHTK